MNTVTLGVWYAMYASVWIVCTIATGGAPNGLEFGAPNASSNMSWLFAAGLGTSEDKTEDMVSDKSHSHLLQKLNCVDSHA